MHCFLSNYNQIKILSEKTADYLEKCISNETTPKSQFYYQCWNDAVHTIDIFIKSILIKNGIVLDKAKILDIICHDENIKTYWNLDMRSSQKIVLTYYYHKSDNIYSIVRSRAVEFSGIPIYIDIGNCIVLVDNHTKQVIYLSKNRKLFYVHRSQNNYIGYCLSASTNKINNIFTKTA